MSFFFLLINVIYINSNTILLRLINIQPLDVVVLQNRFTDEEVVLNITLIENKDTYSIITFSNTLIKEGTYNLIINTKVIDLCTI